MLTLQEIQVQSLLIVQPSQPLARELKEVHMSSLEMPWVSVKGIMIICLKHINQDIIDN